MIPRLVAEKSVEGSSLSNICKDEKAIFHCLKGNSEIVILSVDNEISLLSF